MDNNCDSLDCKNTATFCFYGLSFPKVKWCTEHMIEVAKGFIDAQEHPEKYPKIDIKPMPEELKKALEENKKGE